MRYFLQAILLSLLSLSDTHGSPSPKDCAELQQARLAMLAGYDQTGIRVGCCDQNIADLVKRLNALSSPDLLQSFRVLWLLPSEKGGWLRPLQAKSGRDSWRYHVVLYHAATATILDFANSREEVANARQYFNYMFASADQPRVRPISSVDFLRDFIVGMPRQPHQKNFFDYISENSNLPTFTLSEFLKGQR